MLLVVTGSSAQRGHQLSMKKNMNSQKIIHVFFARIPQHSKKQTSFPSVFPSRESSMMSTHLSPTVITNQYSCLTSIPVTDQRMVRPLFKYGVKTSSIWEMISDATSVPDQQKLTSSVLHSCGAAQPIPMLSVKLSHFPFR